MFLKIFSGTNVNTKVDFFKIGIRGYLELQQINPDKRSMAKLYFDPNSVFHKIKLGISLNVIRKNRSLA